MEETRPNGLVVISNDAYHAGPGISKSHLDCIAPELGGSPRSYWHKYLNPDREPEQSTPAKVLGQAIHTAILEPDLLEESVVPGLEIDRRSNANKAEWAEYEQRHAGKIILPAPSYQTVLAVRDAVHKHPVVAPLLRQGKAEQAFYATHPETGELIKCKTDFMADSGEYILDVKSADSASPDAFARSMVKYRYHVQQPWYQDVLDILYGEHPPYWMFLAIEKEPPYVMGLYYLPREAVDIGGQLAQRDLRRIIECRTTEQWPDHASEAQELALPAWYMRQINL